MPWSLSDVDTVYDNSHAWDSLFNGPPPVPQSPRQRALIDQAMTMDNPATPREYIRATMTGILLRDAGPTPPQPTIESVLDGSALQPNRLYDRAPTDFSDSPASVEATARPTISLGS